MAEANTILVPVDFSSHARAAALRACHLAAVSGGRLRLLHALDLPALAKRRGLGEALFEELRESESQQLDELVSSLAPHGVPIVACLEEREPVEMILEHAADESVELIVMGSHGYRGLDRIFLGSVAERTIREAPVPVVTVKENEWDAAARIRRILLATDFSQDSARALDETIRWGGRLGADVEVLHVIPAVGAVERRGEGEVRTAEARRREALASLQAVLEQMRSEGISAVASLSHGAPSIEIAKRAARIGAELIVVGRRGRSQLAGVVCGSVSDRVQRHAKCSVLLAPRTTRHEDLRGRRGAALHAAVREAALV
ncbi:MAG: universal stress protein [Spirochaetaceae bacterium]|nr:universal stress protein [Myxococcales bacterium]MCB9722407.1 universal stress protein [Spirochaetaceae bacterium]HPG27178.1 universal stress protein [Myxococcota bacterium]